MELTFGEQIKIILKRKNMTIRQLAELIEVQTGKPMSRQNLTQKLNRDNFQEQDMREVAQALGCLGDRSHGGYGGIPAGHHAGKSGFG